MTNVKLLNHSENWWLSMLALCTGTAPTPCCSTNGTWLPLLCNNNNFHSINIARESTCLQVAISFQRDWFFNVNEINRFSPCKYIHSLLWKLNVWQYLSINVFQAMLNVVFSCCLIGMCNLLPGEIMSYSHSYSSWRGILPLHWVNLYQLKEGHSWQILLNLFLRDANLECLQDSSATYLVLRSPCDRKSFLKLSLNFSCFILRLILFVFSTIGIENRSFLHPLRLLSCLQFSLQAITALITKSLLLSHRS